jgi:hypothetical protein
MFVLNTLLPLLLLVMTDVRKRVRRQEEGTIVIIIIIIIMKSWTEILCHLVIMSFYESPASQSRYIIISLLCRSDDNIVA